MTAVPTNVLDPEDTVELTWEQAMTVDPSKTTCDGLKETLKQSNSELLRLHPDRIEAEIPSDQCSALGRRRRLSGMTVKYHSLI